ncbi:hypothetical protein Gxy13693_053_009 [Komagataeibacter xylinus NBRC 13693]|uniref:Uncharacterized protein n=1 Tax=Komagataeibacter xylinus NBRC 13693 TaxID=1234668 RepID=A0A0D6QCB0_KOMXY|nr:hypothetical protein Gxy13693_053_009 [Komagataeibacter xylinus NBRC 13693]
MDIAAGRGTDQCILMLVEQGNRADNPMGTGDGWITEQSRRQHGQRQKDDFLDHDALHSGKKSVLTGMCIRDMSE